MRLGHANSNSSSADDTVYYIAEFSYADTGTTSPDEIRIDDDRYEVVIESMLDWLDVEEEEDQIQTWKNKLITLQPKSSYNRFNWMKNGRYGRNRR